MRQDLDQVQQLERGSRAGRPIASSQAGAPPQAGLTLIAPHRAKSSRQFSGPSRAQNLGRVISGCGAARKPQGRDLGARGANTVREVPA